MIKVKQRLSTGTITINAQPSDWNIDDLFAFAERRNPKRSFLFVSKILGKHIPVSPATMRRSYQDLAKQIPAQLEPPMLFIGMAETAVGLASGIFEEASKRWPNSILLTTTRHPIDGELLCEFKEEHSHATDHLIYWPTSSESISLIKQAKTLILIDDEATTGNTFKNLISSLAKVGLDNYADIVTVTLTDWTGDCLSSVISAPVTQVSLMKGNWQWEANLNAALPVMPNVNITKKGHATISARQDWGRSGVTNYDAHNWLFRFNTYSNERILVLGSGELLYPPFLLAEYLENKGADVLFSSTTRSPIAEGLSIKSSISFTDNYGLNIQNFCYNVAHQQFDRIILCVETQHSTIDNKLLTELSLVAKLVEVAVYE